MTGSRFTDSGNGCVRDTVSGLTWTRADVWLMEERWVTWDEARDWTRKLADDQYAGFNDWRLPNIEEARTLFDPASLNKDKYGRDIHLPTAFPEGGLALIWLEESMTGNDGFLLDLQTGEARTLHKSKCPRMTARAVRGKLIHAAADNK